ncbi:MAG: RnfABCDGE type electron transport complex subunit D, partial [Vicinamibacterales bacterium]
GSRRRSAVRRFFATPKGLLILLLTVLAALAAVSDGVRLIGPGLLSAVVAAAVVDCPILRWRSRLWQVPSGAILTGLLVAMVLSPHEPWYVPAVTSIIAIVSKYVLRTRTANVFNPAALGLVVTFYLFDTGQSWWGALPDAPPWAFAALLAAGLFIADRVNKLPMVLAFLGVYFGLFTASAFVTAPETVVEIFRSPDAQAALFFAFFILTDPPTSPVQYQHQITCALIVAVVSFAVFEWVGAAHYLLAGVLVGNVWEAWSRTRIARNRRRARQQTIAVPPAALVSN